MLSHRSRLIVPTILGLALVLAGEAKAAFITYTITTAGSGRLGSDDFLGAVTLTFVGDTSNVVNAQPGVFYNSLGTATVSIAGLGTATFTTPISVYAYQPGSAVGFFNGSSFSASNYSLGILNLTGAAAYATYDLKSSFGPVVGTGFTSFTTAGFATDRGVFVFPPPNGPNAGTFTASLSAVPEPGSIVMLSTGAFGLIGYGWRRRHRVR